MKSYIEEFRIKSRDLHFDLFDFINSLQTPQLNQFIEDILTEAADISEIFPPSKGTYSEERAFGFLRELPYVTGEKISLQLERVFTNALNGKYLSGQKVIDKILALTARRRHGLRLDFLVELIASEKVSIKLKSRLGILLSKIDDPLCYTFLEYDVDYAKYPYLIPAYVSAFKNTDPIKALNKLKEVGTKPENIQPFLRPIATALENVLIIKRDFRAFRTIYEEFPQWLKPEVEKILDEGVFKTNDIRQDLENFKQGKKEIKIGISLFPDLMMLKLVAREGKFNNSKTDFYTVGLTDWNKIFEDLDNGEFQFILANKQICEEKNALYPSYRFLSPLIEYKGFSLILQKNLKISSFETIRNLNVEDSEKAVLKRTLLQLKDSGIKIFAAKETDHYQSLLEMLKLASLNENDVTIISELSPQEGARMFADGEVEGLVGGLPQKLQALKNNGKELIKSTDFSLPFNQVNGLICLDHNFEKLKQYPVKIINEWREMATRIKKDPKVLASLVQLYNENLAQDDGEYAMPIDEDLLREYWSKTYFIPSTKGEAERLEKQDNTDEVTNLTKALHEINIWG